LDVLGRSSRVGDGLENHCDMRRGNGSSKTNQNGSSISRTTVRNGSTIFEKALRSAVAYKDRNGTFDASEDVYKLIPDLKGLAAWVDVPFKLGIRKDGLTTPSGYNAEEGVLDYGCNPEEKKCCPTRRLWHALANAVNGAKDAFDSDPS
jgi:hypothetical protein